MKCMCKQCDWATCLSVVALASFAQLQFALLCWKEHLCMSLISSLIQFCTLKIRLKTPCNNYTELNCISILNYLIIFLSLRFVLAIRVNLQWSIFKLIMSLLNVMVVIFWLIYINIYIWTKAVRTFWGWLFKVYVLLSYPVINEKLSTGWLLTFRVSIICASSEWQFFHIVLSLLFFLVQTLPTVPNLCDDSIVLLLCMVLLLPLGQCISSPPTKPH